MRGTLQVCALAARDISLLAYADHMARTARSAAARQMFETFVEQEIRHLEAGGGNLSPAIAGQSSPQTSRLSVRQNGARQ